MSNNRFVINDETIKNSYGFKVRSSGVSLNRFKLNPVMLDAHQQNNAAVIGSWNDIKLEGGKITAVPSFDMDDPNAATIAGKVERGIIKGASMGLLFDPANMVMTANGIELTESELAEVSIVPVPSNSQALKLYAKGKDKPLTPGELQQLCLSLKSDNTMTLQEQLITLLGLDAKADDTAILAAIQKLVDDAEAVAQSQQAAVEQKLNLAIQAGKITVSQKPSLMAFAKADLSAFNTMIDSLPEKTSLGAMLHPNGSSKDMGYHLSTGVTKNNKPKSQWTLDDYRQHSPAELSANPTLYNTLVNQKYGK